MLHPFLNKIADNEREGFSTCYLRHFQEFDALFGAVLLKIQLGGCDRIVVMPPLPTCDIGPGITDSLLCENYLITLGVAEDLLPELSNFIQFH